jgi:metallo-beta-lactamase family protein
VGRTQELLFFFAKYFQQWELAQWHIFLDSPMAIQATEVYARHMELYDAETASLWHAHLKKSLLPNLTFTRTANQSMKINQFRSGAIIIAGSGMCNGGRIRHHLKHNIWRSNCHVVIVGFQARGTPGRALVDGTTHLNLWGETVQVAATVHTVGGLSAHADQRDLLHWYSKFNNKPSVYLVHGEPDAQLALQDQLKRQQGVNASIARYGESLDLINL